MRFVHERFIERGERKIRADAVRNQRETAAAFSLRGEKRRKFLFCVPRCLRVIVEADDFAVRKERLLMLRFAGRAAFPMDVYYGCFFHRAFLSIETIESILSNAPRRK